MTFELKIYQTRVLETLKEFLDDALTDGVADAYNEIAHRKHEDGKPINRYASQYQPVKQLEELKNCPHVCIRIPTAGGKTYTAACALPALADYRTAIYSQQMQKPLILWIVPSEAIRAQTVAMLSNPEHPCRQAIVDAFGQSMRVCDVSDFDAVPVSDYINGGCLFVTTAQMFRVKETTKENSDGMSKATRRIYASNETLDPHFAQLLSQPAPKGLERDAKGEIKYSFANLLHLLRPIVVCDEAHNFLSDLSQTVLKRINPACILEWTATPREKLTPGEEKKKTMHNVLATVSAEELQDEAMVKLPIDVTEINNGWENAVFAAAAKRTELAAIAAKHDPSVRPIALYKATDKNGEAPPQELKEYLINTANVNENEIAIVTGEIKELDGVNLLAADCPINHVITVEALREGWDCSFAYLLCSVDNIRSETAAEQLLGRIMRMPFAKRRPIPELNCAYAYFLTDYSSVAVEIIRERLANKLGYEESEAEWMARPNLINFPDAKNQPPLGISVTVENKPDYSSLPSEAQEAADDNIKTAKGTQGYTVNITAPVPAPVIDAIVQATAKNRRAETSHFLHTRNRQLAVNNSPAAQKKKFAAMPQLLFYSPQEGKDVVADCDTLAEASEWNTIDKDECLLRDFAIEKSGSTFRINIVKGKTQIIQLEGGILPLFAKYFDDETRWRATLSARLEEMIRDRGGRYFPETLKELIAKNLDFLLAEKELSLIDLFVVRSQLARALKEKLSEHEKQVEKQMANTFLFDNKELKCDFNFSFPLHTYEPTATYKGHYQFKKHYYGIIGDFESSEEYECAKLLDLSPHVQYWIRNLVKQDGSSYRLPVGKRNFYPDFIAMLTNGKILVLEHKGGHILADSVFKKRIGETMERLAKGKCYFLMSTVKDGHSLLSQQINNKISEMLKP